MCSRSMAYGVPISRTHPCGGQLSSLSTRQRECKHAEKDPQNRDTRNHKVRVSIRGWKLKINYTLILINVLFVQRRSLHRFKT